MPGLREISKQPLCKVFDVIFFPARSFCVGSSPRELNSPHSAPMGTGEPRHRSFPATKQGSWQESFMTDAGLVATALLYHANCMASSSHPLPHCQPRGCSWGFNCSTNSVPSLLALHGVLFAPTKGFDPARAKQCPAGIKCLNPSSE